MEDFRRYAVFTAPKGDLAAFGAAWLGWDSTTGRTVPRPDIGDLPAAISDLTRAPGRYGLHGTLKAPFRLSAGARRSDLDAALAECASAHPPVSLTALKLARIDGFLALTPVGDTRELDRLAADAVRRFERFRAPLNARELAKRRKSGLTERQEDLLSAWGYPFVMDEFRFHITLTGALDADAAPAVHETLSRAMRHIRLQPYLIDDICLFGEDHEGWFHLLARAPLSAAPEKMVESD